MKAACVRLALAAALCLSCLAAKAVNVAAMKAGLADKVEKAALSMMPKKQFDEMLGFFGPVTKKYLPVFNTFNREYLASTNKIAVVKKYLPKAQSALDDARKMKIPPKYEAQKAGYLSKLSAFLTMTKLTVRLAE